MWRSVDLASRRFWRVFGRPVDLVGEHAWLDTPRGAPGSSGDDWLRELEGAGQVRRAGGGAGLLGSMAELDGPLFDSAKLHPVVRDFYERTSSWEMQVWSQWSPLFAPGGELVARLFGRRVGQLALPVQPLAVSRGMSSSVRVIDGDRPGVRLGAAWLRTLRSDGSRVYGGFYRVGMLPRSAQPHVHVSFPLEEGNVQVFLSPTVGSAGSLWLQSGGREFGGDGAYVLARSGGRWFAALVPLRESFHVFVDPEGVLRTDHVLKVAAFTALQLHYRLDPSPE
ncbi:MAG: hypothetical protein HOQ24_10975 [Mycobacteriaceae bacterium]|nr:hypothetical protein [Mycobacteriaceae bacterium]